MRKNRMRFSTGDPVPWFTAATQTQQRFKFSTAAGRYVILSFFGSAKAPAARRLIADVEANSSAFRDDELCFFGVSVDRGDFRERRMRPLPSGVRYFQDLGGEISRAYGALGPAADPAPNEIRLPAGSYRPFSLLLDQRLRVLAQLPLLGDGADHLPQLLELARELPGLGEQRVADIPAPVLIVPRVFEPELCRTLIDLYESRGGEDSGFMVEEGGKTVGKYDYKTKRRSDCDIECEHLRKQCMNRIRTRLLPEIKRAFQFQATRMERYIVASYDGDHGGHFRAHRDNTTPATAHRRFAVSLNLNADEYEGGHVWFPEFGRQLYKPPTGGAAVFSCSLLHEATPVTRGVRYVFLPFLYDEAAAKGRQPLPAEKEETRQPCAASGC
ncbi:hypothetical protein ABI59_15195 [Acidobacteria bacterium Mor1]|nr:hypothetical protein ABI59_15195 [Acidobacteria bacterium Mor1]